jgi:GTPase SAR1 family protein
VGNKTDLTNERQVTAKRALKEFKEEFDLDCWEVSAKTGHNVKEMFASMFESTPAITQRFT